LGNTMVFSGDTVFFVNIAYPVKASKDIAIRCPHAKHAKLFTFTYSRVEVAFITVVYRLLVMAGQLTEKCGLAN